MKNFLIFERALYEYPLDKRFYRFCLLRQPALIRFFFARLLYAFLHLLGLVGDERFFDHRWRFLKSVTALERKTNAFWKREARHLNRIFEQDDNLWISQYPALLLQELADSREAALVAPAFNLLEGRFAPFEDLDTLYRRAAHQAHAALIVDGAGSRLKTGVETLYVNSGRVYDSRRRCKLARALQIGYTVGVLLCMGVGLGLISLYFGASSYIMPMFLSYFKIPLTVLLNLLPVVVLVFFCYFLFNRVWAAFAVSATITMVFTWINYYKLQLRDDPLLAVDLGLASEVGTILERYTIELNWKVISVIVFCVLLTIAAVFLAKGRLRSARVRLTGLLVLVCASICVYSTVYVSDTVYAKTENLSLISQWSATQQYISRGFVYPFIYSIKSARSEPPEGYSEQAAQEILAQYTDATIPEEERVAIVGVMLEAFNDFSKFDDKISLDPSVYEAFHELQARSYSGELITNIFAGGTVDTEWAFLTGNTEHGEYRKDTSSYVRYLKSQGYYAEGSHPCYEWFYNRQNVNQYLGFDNYYFYENMYYDLSGGIADDDILFPQIIELLETHYASSDQPYFSFNVTYQNHGPYSGEQNYGGVDYVLGGDFTEEERNILNNYFHGVKNTCENVLATAEYFESMDIPVIFVVFGDHNPWMGYGNSVYTAMGLDFDFDEDEGFYDYYCTPYLIFANSAAKDVRAAISPGRASASGRTF